MFDKSRSFSEEDQKQLVKFLNMIASKAKFEFNVNETIEFYKLLSWSQQTLLKKIEANIVGEAKLHENKPEKSKKDKK